MIGTTGRIEREGVDIGEGTIIASAPFSVQVQFASDKGETVTQWHIWEPGTGRHGKQHGMPADTATWFRQEIVE